MFVAAGSILTFFFFLIGSTRTMADTKSSSDSDDDSLDLDLDIDLNADPTPVVIEREGFRLEFVLLGSPRSVTSRKGALSRYI